MGRFEAQIHIIFLWCIQFVLKLDWLFIFGLAAAADRPKRSKKVKKILIPSHGPSIAPNFHPALLVEELLVCTLSKKKYDFSRTDSSGYSK